MSKHLYTEALADVRQLKEAAEADVKRALVDALSPKISRLVERTLMQNLDEDSSCDDDEEVLSDDADEHVAEAADVVDGETQDVETGDTQPATKVDTAHITPADIMSGGPDIDAQLESLEADVALFEAASPKMKAGRAYLAAIVEKIGSLDDSYGYVQENVSDLERKAKLEERLERVYEKLTMIQETVGKMAKQRINEEDVTLKLTNLPEIPDLENVGIDLITDVDGEDEVADDELDAAEGEGEGDDLDLDFGDEPANESAELTDDTVVEIDEQMLRTEIARAKSKLAEGDHPANIIDDFGDGKSEGDPLDAKISTADNTKLAEAVMKRATDRLVRLRTKLKECREVGNKRMEEVVKTEIRRTNARIAEQKAIVEGKKNVSMRAQAPIKNTVTENRAVQRQTETAETKKLRKQLAESNLYVAKLQYANKLLQTDGLSTKQKAQAVARLDEAKTPREAKIVYDSVAKTFGRRTVTEGTNRIAGRASAPMGRATTLNEGASSEGIEVDRWAVLAGLK